jgi:hypothetical protein
VTHLFTVLFFATVLGTAVAILWSVVDEHRELVLAHLPWKPRSAATQAPVTVRAPRLPAYWATPSISSELPIRANRVSPATVL